MPKLRPKAHEHERAAPTGAVVALPEHAERARFARSLLRWYRGARRDLPWRNAPEPYAVWVSEIMLQQTQVATVVDYFTRFMRRFPSLRALAEAPEDTVLHAWQGLGYYSRARNLQRTARLVQQQHAGQLPRDAETLQTLPGIGRYTAGAIASIANGLPAPIVDGNVIRLLCRHFGLYGDPTRAPLKQALWQLAEALIPQGSAGDFNQALMEMGATCCTPKQPLCERCPVRGSCHARANDTVTTLPQTPARPEVTRERHVALLARHRGAYLLEQCAEDAPRWAGLWQFPSAVLSGRQRPEAALKQLARARDLELGDARQLLEVRHSITRYRIELLAFHCNARPQSGRSSSTRRWLRATQFHEYALPAPHARIAAALQGGAEGSP